MCGLKEYTIVGTALSPTLIMYLMSVFGPGYLSDVVCIRSAVRSTEVRTQDFSIHAPKPTVGFMEAAQILAWATPIFTCPQSPQLLKSYLSQVWEPSLSTEIFHQH